MGLAIGFQVWASHVAWADLMAAGRAIDAAGFDSLWSNDHFLPAVGPEEVIGRVDGPIFEAWTVLAGWTAVTSRVRLGCLVSAAGYRNPGLLVKMVTALDHATGGRMALGLGAGWHAREHAMFGFALPGVRERLDRLEEGAAICRRLLDGERVSVAGRWWTVEEAVNDPPPVQRRLPLVVGGSGERRTLRIVARYANWWCADGNDPAEFARKNAILDAHCADLGRDPALIRRTAGQAPPLVRDDRAEAVRLLAAALHRHGMPARLAREAAETNPYCGPARAVADRLTAMAEAGCAEVMLDWMSPFDPPTLEAIARIREEFGGH